jgi:hypothetical protein
MCAACIAIPGNFRAKQLSALGPGSVLPAEQRAPVVVWESACALGKWRMQAHQGSLGCQDASEVLTQLTVVTG